MHIDEAGVSREFLEVLKGQGITNLNPVQASAIKAGLLSLEKSFVISSPTASGKTLIAELMMVKAALEKKCKAIYIVPLRALANEKYESFKQRYSQLGLKVGISTGDYDSKDSWLKEFDIIVLTSEKTDSLLRHRAEWIREVGVAVIDEVHLLNDPGRGPTLEVTITRLSKINPGMLFLFLSATIKNAQDLARWIDAKLVCSEWRPVKLHEGVYDGEEVKFSEKKGFAAKGEKPGEVLLSTDTVRLGKQALIFASTRRNAEAIAERCGPAVRELLSPEEAESLGRLAAKVEKALESPTKQCRRLARCVRMGAAFHHAGLVGAQRSAVEKAFRERLVKIIAATPTLAAGVDLPAFRVMIRDAKRYYPSYGYTWIPVLEYEQMRGRAGRPRYDSEGESILMGKDSREAEELLERYVYGETEEIYSKLALEPVLRMHTLALVATEIVKSEQELYDFFSDTFYGYQFADDPRLMEKLRAVLDELIEWRFIIQLGRELRATALGTRVSELYIDPETAHNFVEVLEGAGPTQFGLLQLIASARELYPQLRVRDREFKEILNLFAEREGSIMQKIPEEWDAEFEGFLDAFKTALMFEDWCSELGEDVLLSKFDVTPGELYSKKEIADWLLYACNEIAYILRKRMSLPEIRKMRIRMKYGVREELLPLVRLKGIGRVRARLLFRSGIKGTAQLKSMPVQDLARIVGQATAKSVKEQLGNESLNSLI